MMGLTKAEEAAFEQVLIKYDFEWVQAYNTHEQNVNEIRAREFKMDEKELELYNKVRDFQNKPAVSPHGKVVETRFEAYHDVTVYEDGHEEWYYIGD